MVAGLTDATNGLSGLIMNGKIGGNSTAPKRCLLRRRVPRSGALFEIVNYYSTSVFRVSLLKPSGIQTIYVGVLDVTVH